MLRFLGLFNYIACANVQLYKFALFEYQDPHILHKKYEELVSRNIIWL